MSQPILPASPPRFLHTLPPRRSRGLWLLPRLALLVLPMVPATAAHAANDAATPNPVLPGDMHTGALLVKTSKGLIEAVRVRTDVDVTVSGPTARARVTQVFRNPTDRWVEGTYLYPLPEGAAVDTLKMVVGTRIIVADVAERAKARATYEAARAEGRQAALTEEERPNIFTNSVANVGPGQSVVVQVEYQEPVHQAGGAFSLRVPLVVAPRYDPVPIVRRAALASDGGGWGTVGPVPDRDRIEPPVVDPRGGGTAEPVTLAVHLHAGFPLAGVSSATHAVTVTATDPTDREIVLKDAAAQPDRDFELAWTPVDSRIPTVGLFREHLGSDDYLLAFVTPPTAPGAAPPKPRDVVFVIDNSGSMGGTSIAQARASLLFALGRLRPEDRFNVIRFDDTMDRLYPAPVPTDATHVDEAKAFVAAIEARGGTEMIPPLRAALEDHASGDVDRVRQVVFLTDGEIGNEQGIFDLIARARGRSRVFMVGIGSAPNGYLMARAAELGRGSYTPISTGAEVQARMQALEEKLEGTVAGDLAATVTGGGADLTPAMLPDLYRGEPLVVAARVDGAAASGALEVSGRISDAPWRISLPIAEAAPGAGLSKVWARRKIDDAEVARTMGTLTQAEADATVTALALRHHLVTRLTSLVAVDRTPSRPAGTPLTRADVPLLLPAGWDFDSNFGHAAAQDPLRRAGVEDAFDARRFDGANRDAPGTAVAAMADPVSPDRQVPLPQTGTDAELRLLAGLGFLAVASAWLARSRRAAVR